MEHCLLNPPECDHCGVQSICRAADGFLQNRSAWGMQHVQLVHAASPPHASLHPKNPCSSLQGGQQGQHAVQPACLAVPRTCLQNLTQKHQQENRSMASPDCPRETAGSSPDHIAQLSASTPVNRVFFQITAPVHRETCKYWQLQGREDNYNTSALSHGMGGVRWLLCSPQSLRAGGAASVQRDRW